MCLCLDLVFTLSNPFYPASRRMKPYLLFSVVSTGVLMGIMEFNRARSCSASADIRSLYNSSSDLTNIVFALLLSIYIIIALYSCVYAMRRLSRPGVSSNVRWTFLRKHFLYVIVFIVVWTTFLAASYYHLFNPSKRLEKTSPVIDTVSTIASFSTGIFLTLIRLQEPYFKFLIKK